MPLMPKRVKHRKVQRGSRAGLAQSNTELSQGDYGLKFEMVRHFRHCSIGFYLEKGGEMHATEFRFENVAPTNGGFRFQIALPPYRMKRHGWIPRVTTSGQIGMSYNANNEAYFYKEFRAEADDNIMSANYFNPYYINGRINE